MFPARRHSFGYLGIGSAVCLLFVLSALAALGQSGRRGSKSPPVAVPTPEAKQPEKKPVSDQPKLNLIVGLDRGSAFGNIPSYYYDSVLESCAGRLNDSSGVRLEVVPREITRGEAIKRAKGEKEAFVVWLQLRTDAYSRTSSTNLDQLYIEYTLFEPTTAKIRTQGNSYQAAYRQGGIAIPGTGGTNTMIAERRLREAAQVAAEKILKALHLASASDIPPHWN